MVRWLRKSLACRKKPEAGMSLIELLFTAGLFAIMGIAVASSAIMATESRGRAQNHSVAMQLAIEEVERLAAIDPSLLSSAQNQDIQVSREGRLFQRETEITVNSDQSRTVSVSVENVTEKMRGRVSLEETFPLWGSQ